MRSAPAASPPRTWPRYRDNLARHLIAISRDLQSRVSRSLQEDRGYEGLRLSFGPFLSLLWGEGRPLASIASELAISRQACSQLANRIEGAGYLERRTHPQDRRSRLVVLTARGRALVEEGAQIILASECEYEVLVGPSAHRRFTSALAALFRGLGLPAHLDPALAAGARPSVGVLPLIAVRIERELMEATIARDHPGLKMSFGQVLTLIGPEGGRIHEIARLQGVSRQAISAISQELEALGYLQRRPDPRDRRGVVLRLTRRGAALIGDSVAALDELDVSFREILGVRQLDQLKRTARDLSHALHLEEEIFGAADRDPPPPVARRGRRREADRHDIQQLATRLRRQLGSGDAAHLAALLKPRGRKRAT
ncbi:MAG: hypothetical protein CL910_04420 [Deltaproteobacteria bacterium]|jgi:DNA-binding MarR family transcriptional regulator|nr:hypothetical protein [Deltaproteobacteria bacterium]